MPGATHRDGRLGIARDQLCLWSRQESLEGLAQLFRRSEVDMEGPPAEQVAVEDALLQPLHRVGGGMSP